MSNLTAAHDLVTPETEGEHNATLLSTAFPKPAFNAARNNDAPEATSSFGEAGPGLVLFLGALAVISVGVVALLCGSVCITASKRAKRRAHFRNKIRSQCPPCPECGALCKEPPGVFHIAMCDVHGPIPTTVRTRSQTNLAFVKDGVADGARGSSQEGSRLLSLRGVSEEESRGKDEAVVQVAKPVYFQTPTILLNSDTNGTGHKIVHGE